MRKDYLEKHRPILFQKMLLEESLYPHLREIDETARRRAGRDDAPAGEGGQATEALKAADPMSWVGLMNNCKAQAEEIILSELVFS